MDLGLAGRTAIITGGGSGIGKAICHRLANEGCRVVVVDLYRERADAVAREISEVCGNQTLAVVADVSKSADVERMIVAASREPGGLDVLVNNAGIILQAQALDMSEPQWS